MAHSHTHPRSDDGASPLARERRMFGAFLLTAGFMIVEAVGGWISGSLALIADAGHMLTDALALFGAWAAFRVGRRQADAQRSYGYRRIEILVAWANGLTVIGLAVWIGVEAVGRILQPTPILGGTMLTVAVIGLAFNLAVLKMLHGGHDHGDLNTRGAVLHVLGDLLGSVATVGAAVAVLAFEAPIADPILSIAVAGLMAFSAVRLVGEASHILMEGTPANIDLAEVCAALAAEIDGLADVHHPHAWSLTADRPLMTLHATIEPGADHDAVLAAIKTMLVERFGIDHSVVQVERDRCPDDGSCDVGPGPACERQEPTPI